MNLVIKINRRSALLWTACLAVAAGCPPGSSANEDVSAVEEIIVVAARVETPLTATGLSVSTLSAEDLELLGYNDLAAVLDLQTGVTVTQDGGLGKAAAVRIRGEDGFRTRILLDGIDIADPSSPQVSPRIEHLLTSGVHRIEILRGPQGLLYGADAGGVIAINTVPDATGWAGSLGSEVGANGSRRINGHMAGSGERVRASLHLARLDTDGFNARADDTINSDRDGYGNQTLHGTVSIDLTSHWRVGATAHSMRGDNDYDNCFDAVTFASSNACEDDYAQQAWRSWMRWSNDEALSEWSYEQSTIERTLYSGGTAVFDTEGEQKELSWLGTMPLLGGQATLGIDRLEQGFTDAGVRKERDNTGMYGEYRKAILAGNVTLGVRHDDNEDFGEHTSWRVSALQALTDGARPLSLHAAVGTGFRAPSPYEIAYNQGPFATAPATQQALEEERSRGWEIGLRMDADDRWLRLTWFDQRIKNAIDFDLMNFSGYLQQLGTSSSRGAELEGSAPLTRSFSIWGNLMWNDTEDQTGNARPYRPKTSGSVSLRWQESVWRSALTARAYRDRVDSQGAAMPDYAVIDWSVLVALTPALSANLRIENITDRDYEQIRQFNTPGRQWFLGMEYSL